MKKVRQPCEVYSRVVGYYRPVQQFNKAKQDEYFDRKEYNKQLEEAEEYSNKEKS